MKELFSNVEEWCTDEQKVTVGEYFFQDSPMIFKQVCDERFKDYEEELQGVADDQYVSAIFRVMDEEI